MHAGTSGVLRVGAFATADAALVPRALARFRATHPSVGLSLLEGVTGGLLAALLAGDADMVLVTAAPTARSTTPGSPPTTSGEPVLLAVRDGHRLSIASAVRLAELTAEAWIAGSAAPEETLLRRACASGSGRGSTFVAGEWTASSASSPPASA